MNVIIHIESIGGFFGVEVGKVQLQVRWFLEGRRDFGAATLQIPMGLSFADTHAAILDAVKVQAQEFNDPIPPDAVVSFWGGPQPTLADLSAP